MKARGPISLHLHHIGSFSWQNFWRPWTVFLVVLGRAVFLNSGLCLEQFLNNPYRRPHCSEKCSICNSALLYTGSLRNTRALSEEYIKCHYNEVLFYGLTVKLTYQVSTSAMRCSFRVNNNAKPTTLCRVHPKDFRRNWKCILYGDIHLCQLGQWFLISFLSFHFLWDGISLCSLDWLWVCDPPVSASSVL